MHYFNYKKQIAHSLRLTAALGAVALLSGQAAHAGINFFNPLTDTAASLGAGTDTTGVFPAGVVDAIFPTSGDVTSPFPLGAGTNTLKFTALVSNFPSDNVPGAVSFANDTNTKSDPNSPDNSTRLFDIASDNVIETANLSNFNPTGALQIDFAQGVTGFGLNAEDFSFVDQTFTITAYNGATQLGTFTTPLILATGSAPGQSAFLGAQTTGTDVITQLTISSTSTLPDLNGIETDTGDGNHFVFGPVTVANVHAGAPVPEASTVVGSGFGLLLFAGLLWKSGKRKASAS